METMTPAYTVFYAVGIVAVPIIVIYGAVRWLGTSPPIAILLGTIAAVVFAALA